MPYLTYEEFTGYGGKLDGEAFPRFECRARKRIDYLTGGRVQKMEVVPEAVKLAMMEIIRADQKTGAEALAENPLVASFNTDGYSESYGSASDQAGLIGRQLDSTVCQLLYGEVDDMGVPLLYRGVAGEYPYRGWGG